MVTAGLTACMRQLMERLEILVTQSRNLVMLNSLIGPRIEFGRRDACLRYQDVGKDNQGFQYGGQVIVYDPSLPLQ